MKVAILHDALATGAPADQRDVLEQARLVERALEENGHDVVRAVASSDLGDLRQTLLRARPDLVFNLVESLDGRAEGIARVPALLESLGIRFTGASSRALLETSDKLRAKRRLREHGLPTPAWIEAGGAGARGRRRRWILKPRHEDASVGIDDGAVIAGTAGDAESALAARARRLGVPLFAEAFVAGREFNLALLAKPGGIEVLPVAEIRFAGFPRSKPRIVGYDAKWSVGSFEHEHTPRRFEFPAAEAGLLAALEQLGIRCFELFGLSGYARVDLRLDRKRRPWVLEVNANPCLSPDAGFLAAAARRNLAPAAVVERIVSAVRPASA